MLDQKTGIPKPGRAFPPAPPLARRQQRLMVVALTLLVMSLVLVLYRDRDFWFPDTQQADAQPPKTAPEARNPPTTASIDNPEPKKLHLRSAVRNNPQLKNDPPDAPATVISMRTVLPPLEVEVVAGDAHQTLRPGSNAVHVDLQRSPSAQDRPAVTEDLTETPAGRPTNAAERASVSSDSAATIVTESVQPEYPMLARQMKVQGSVILQALIGEDGLIQDLRVLSGPPILATAAREAVRQWHFKPHYEGTRAVETRTNITVNFMISTN